MNVPQAKNDAAGGGPPLLSPYQMRMAAMARLLFVPAPDEDDGEDPDYGF